MAVVRRDEDTLVVTSSDRPSPVTVESGETYLRCTDSEGNVWMKSDAWVRVD